MKAVRLFWKSSNASRLLAEAVNRFHPLEKLFVRIFLHPALAIHPLLQYYGGLPTPERAISTTTPCRAKP